MDLTPADDLEFNAMNDDALHAAPDSEAGARMDLLTAVIHEIGHYLGYEHADSGADLSVMEDTLAAGERLVLSPTITDALTNQIEPTVATEYSVPASDALSIAVETLDEVRPAVISETSNRVERKSVSSDLSGEISSDDEFLIRTYAVLASVPVPSSTADTDRSARHYLFDPIDVKSGRSLGSPQTTVVLRRIDIDLGSGRATNLPTMAMVDAYNLHDAITQGLAIFIYQREYYRGERQLVHAQRRPERQPRRDSALAGLFVPGLNIMLSHLRKCLHNAKAALCEVLSQLSLVSNYFQ